MSSFNDSVKGRSADADNAVKMLTSLIDDAKFTAMAVEINVSPRGVLINIVGNGLFAKNTGLENTIKAFGKEVEPIAEKYAKIVAEKVAADFHNFVMEKM